VPQAGREVDAAVSGQPERSNPKTDSSPKRRRPDPPNSNRQVDVYGSGPDLDAVQEEAARRRLALKFNGAKDHADSSLQVRGGAVRRWLVCRRVAWSCLFLSSPPPRPPAAQPSAANTNQHNDQPAPNPPHPPIHPPIHLPTHRTTRSSSTPA